MKRMIWMLTAILMLCGANVLTSCSRDDDTTPAVVHGLLGYGGSKPYETVGMKLVDSVIKQNQKYI